MEPDSKAARLISSFPITAENYPKLKLRFGREDLLVQIYVRNLLSLVLKNAMTGKNAPDLATLYDMLETKLRALESLGRTKEKFADFLELLVESCLPENVLRAWERRRISESTDDATNLRKEKETNFSSKDRTTDNEQKSTETLLTNLPSEHEIYLKTIMIRLRNRDKEDCVRALLDEGSQWSYIEKNLAAELFLSPSGREIFSQGLFGGGISPASEHKRYMVNVESLNAKYTTPLSLLEQQKICSTLPRIHDRKLLASRGIKLTDVGRDSPSIRVLLGADILGSILTGRIEVLSSGVSAVETLLGWTIL
ncbi:DUF1758 domain-containing protein [Trichonephila clavipes]|nr:DUF1758 domain-containing protein [Trichonephila clavipes]